MNKTYCDRCGKEIIETKRTVFDSLHDSLETLKANLGGKHRITYWVQVIDLDDPTIPYPIADLCEHCKLKLADFMNYTHKAKDENDCSLIILDKKTMNRVKEGDHK